MNQHGKVKLAVLLGFFDQLQIVAVNVAFLFGYDDLIPIALRADDRYFLTGTELVDDFKVQACAGTKIQAPAVCYDRSDGCDLCRVGYTVDCDDEVSVIVDGVIERDFKVHFDFIRNRSFGLRRGVCGGLNVGGGRYLAALRSESRNRKARHTNHGEHQAKNRFQFSSHYFLPPFHWK